MMWFHAFEMVQLYVTRLCLLKYNSEVFSESHIWKT